MKHQILFCFLAGSTLLARQAASKPSDKELAQEKARGTIEKSIEAMGGAKFRQVREMQSRGHYYIFKAGQVVGTSKYTDQTRLPDKSRFQLGEGKNKDLTVFDLAAGKGWHMEGKKDIKEATPEEMQQFRQAVRHSIDNLLRDRLREPGMSLFYYGREDVSGRDDVEAVEMIDADNDSVLLYFDLKTHLPTRMEYVEADARGNRRKQATEFYVWHSIAGVMTPFRLDNFVEGQMASQLFLDDIVYNPSPGLSDSLFIKPSPDK